MITVHSNYQPRPQQIALHKRENRFLVDVLHRRFGKTVYAINKLIIDLMQCPHPRPRVHYCCPFRNQAKNVAWDYAKHYTSNIPGVTYNNTELRVDFPNGGRLQLLGADKPDSIRGIYSDSFCFDETAQISPRMWTQIVRPALADREGKAHFIGTPMGQFNLFYDVWQQAGEGDDDWARCLMTVEDTGLIAQSELEAARAEMDENDFNQEFYCSWSAAIRGAYYGKAMAEAERDKRIGRVPYDPQLPVLTAWDLGMRDSTAIWFIQQAGAEIRCIEYREYTGTGLPEIIHDLKQLPYVYDGFIGPHDLKVRELGTGVSRLETAAKLGVKFRVAKQIPVVDGINATRNMIPKMWFDEQKCKQGIEALRMYRSDYDDVKRIYSVNPVHDWASHGADALRYFAVAMQGGNWRKHAGQLNYDMLDRVAI